MRDNLTKSDIEKMEAEIEHRKVVVRHELLEHVKTARAQGDLSENFEYYAAKKEKNKNESRIRYLERMIRTANVVDHQLMMRLELIIRLLLNLSRIRRQRLTELLRL